MALFHHQDGALAGAEPGDFFRHLRIGHVHAVDRDARIAEGVGTFGIPQGAPAHSGGYFALHLRDEVRDGRDLDAVQDERLFGEDHQRAEHLGSDQGQGLGEVVRAEVNFMLGRRQGRRGAAVVRNGLETPLQGIDDDELRDMPDAADSAVRSRQPALFQALDKILAVLDRRVIRYAEGRQAAEKDADHAELLVGQLREPRRRKGAERAADPEEAVAVLGLLVDMIHGNDRVGAHHVDDGHGHTQGLFHLFREQPPQHVHAAARGETNVDRYGPGRPFLLRGHRWNG